MTHQKILERAITKAIEGGWNAQEESVTGLLLREYPNSFIFDHDFARAIWGQVPTHGSPSPHTYNWAWHLQQMVIAENPIDYLGQHL